MKQAARSKFDDRGQLSFPGSYWLKFLRIGLALQAQKHGVYKMDHSAYKKKSMAELQRLSTNEAQEQYTFPVVLVLDNVRSMHNVGSVFRTADSFGLQEIVLCGFTPTPPHREIHKTALGATDTVKWHYTEEISQSLTELKDKGYKIIAAEQVHNSISLETLNMKSKEPVAIIFGNEVEGVSEKALSFCDAVVEIPQFGAKHSLNISVSVGIICWELVRSFPKND